MRSGRESTQALGILFHLISFMVFLRTQSIHPSLYCLRVQVADPYSTRDCIHLCCLRDLQLHVQREASLPLRIPILVYLLFICYYLEGLDSPEPSSVVSYCSALGCLGWVLGAIACAPP
jgi:hypothetical protein